jgi:hypothetical protein
MMDPKELTVKPTSVAEFMKRAREARHDTFGLANDLEATMALVGVHRNAFIRDRTEQSLRRWRELVLQIVSGSLPDDPALVRWLAIEHVRLAVGFMFVSVVDAALNADVTQWAERLDANDRSDEMNRFELDMAAPIKVGAVASRG